MNRYKAIKIKGTKETRDEHRLLMESHLGRRLSFNEVVHHKNNNPRDNRLENLEVMSRAEHGRIHHIGRPGRVRPLRERIYLSNLHGTVSEDNVKRIRFGNERAFELARELGLTKYTISRIRRGLTYKHVVQNQGT